MRHNSVPSGGINAALLAFVIGFSVLVFGAGAALGLHGPGALALVLAAALTAPLHWGLLHESIHGKLFAGERLNRLGGRLLGVTLLLNWDVMRFAHLYHHRENRHSRDRPEELAPGRSWWQAAPVYFVNLLGGQEAQAMAAPLAVMLPLKGTIWTVNRLFGDGQSQKLLETVMRVFTDAERRLRIRTDFVLAVAAVALAIRLWGPRWYVFAACVAARFAVLSLLDNAPHYGTAISSGRYARDTWMSPALRWLVLNSNFHGIHHRNPDLGWRELPLNFAAGNGRYEGSWAAMVLRQFRGPMHLPAYDGAAAQR